MPVRLSVSFYLQTLGIHLDQNRAVFIRSQQLRAAVSVALYDFLFRMAETVAISNGEYCIIGLHGGNKFVRG
jgi:hypothetical protein